LLDDWVIAVATDEALALQVPVLDPSASASIRPASSIKLSGCCGVSHINAQRFSLATMVLWRRGVKGEIDELLDDWVIAVATDEALALQVPGYSGKFPAEKRVINGFLATEQYTLQPDQAD
jgi:hypothetical protein